MIAVRNAIDDAIVVQLIERVDHWDIAAGVWHLLIDAEEQRLLVHNLVANLNPLGTIGFAGSLESVAPHVAACGLQLESTDTEGVHTFRRRERIALHDLIAAARSRFVRVDAVSLHAALARQDGPTVRPIVLDTRTLEDRNTHGFIADSLHAPRTVLEWITDPDSGYTDPAITSFEQRLVVVCNEGYSSSFAAASLLDLGFVNATDLIGGIAAWKRAKLPLQSTCER